MAKTISVGLFQKTGTRESTLDYICQDDIECERGDLVRIPLRTKSVMGIVRKLTTQHAAQDAAKNALTNAQTGNAKRFKNIESIVLKNAIQEWQLSLFEWMADAYLTDVSRILGLAIPERIRNGKIIIENRTTKIKNETEKNTSISLTYITQDREEFEKKLLEEINIRETATNETDDESPGRSRQGSILIVSPSSKIQPFWAEELQKSHPDAIWWNTGLTPKKRALQWKNIYENTPHILIGSRGTFFAPLKNIKKIIVISEHETGHSEDQKPKFHTRHLAEKIQTLTQADVTFLGTSCSIEHAKNMHEKIQTNQKSQTFNFLRRTDIQIRIESSRGTSLSGLAEQALQSVEEHDGQALILINKKDSSSSFFCKECKNLMRREQNRPAPDTCTKCGGYNITPLGLSHTRLSASLKKDYPNIKSEMLFLEEKRTPKAWKALYRRMQNKETNLLIASDLLNTLDPVPLFPVVILNDIDGELFSSRYDGAERALHRLTKAASLLRPKGLLIIETRLIDHSLLTHFTQNTLKDWTMSEMLTRKRLAYPPFGNIFVITHILNDENALCALGEKLMENNLSSRITRKIQKNGTKPMLTIKGGTFNSIQSHMPKSRDFIIQSAIPRGRDEPVALDKPTQLG